MGNNINKILINNYINSLKTNSAIKKKNTIENKNGGTSFQKIFEEKIYELKFSRHAIQQIQKRDISINEQDYLKIKTGFLKSKTKGSKEALFIVNGKGFLISVKNGVVITCFKREDLKENIITNIDSVYID